MKNGWKEVALREASVFVSTGPFGSMLHKSDYVDDGVPVVNPTNMLNARINIDRIMMVSEKTKERLSRYTLLEGDVVVARRGELGRCAVVGPDEEGWLCGTGSFFVRPLKTTNPRYLSYLFMFTGVRERLEEASTGATMKNLSNSTLSKLAIPLPPPTEQKRIVTILDDAFERIDTAIANTERNIANAKELFGRYLDNAFVTKSGDWRTYPLASLCEKKRGISYGVIKLGVEVPEGIPCLRTSNVRWLTIETDNVKRIDKELSLEYNRTILQGGEVLVNIRGTLGGVAAAPKEMKGWNVSREVAVVPVDNAMVNSEFLAFYIGSKGSQAWLANVHKGVAYTGINLSDLRDLPIALPDVKIQQNVVEEIKQVMEHSTVLQSVQKQRLNSLSELKQSLLQKAFAGELSTDFNPDSLVN